MESDRDWTELRRHLPVFIRGFYYTFFRSVGTQERKRNQRLEEGRFRQEELMKTRGVPDERQLPFINSET